MTLDYTANRTPVEEGTLCELFFEAVDRFGDSSALCFFEGQGVRLRSITYDEAHGLVKALAAAMKGRGLGRGDRVAILSENRPEWAITDYACLAIGVEDVPVYATLPPDQIAYILGDSGARTVFASDDEQVAKVVEAGEILGSALTIVRFDGPAVSRPDTPEAILWDDLVEEGRKAVAGWSDDAFREEALGARPGDVATLIYTSGTTGEPKGVMLTHNNLASNVRACETVLDLGPDDRTLSFLPLSHVFQRMVDYLLFHSGCSIAYAHSIRTVPEDLRTVRPTLVVSVPRLYEKVHAKVMEAEGLKGRLVSWAARVGDEWTDAELLGGGAGAWTRLRHWLADRLVYRKIRQGVGGRLRFFVSGGAPLPEELHRFFYGAGILILQGYGLTETSPVTNVNTPEDFRIGTVGKAVPGTEISIAEDGEILVRGPQVMKGYFGKPDATAAVIDDEGWFRTGDVGEIDDEGFLRITDRKKDMIVTSGGKNIAPQPIENRLKRSRYVEQVVMVGDRRKFPAVLVVPAFDALSVWARERGIEASDRLALLRNEQVHELYKAEVLDEVEDLARYEQPKKLGLVATEFTIENGLLTPTQKVKRREVEARFDRLIDRFYEEETVDQEVFVAEEGRSPV